MSTSSLSRYEPHTITVRVEGGVIQGVEDVPAGVTVRVVDYDNDDDQDETGEPCSIGLYRGEPDPSGARTLADAAPELLQALRDLLACFWDGRPKRNVRRDYHLMVAAVAAQNAITRAEGRQP